LYNSNQSLDPRIARVLGPEAKVVRLTANRQEPEPRFFGRQAVANSHIGPPGTYRIGNAPVIKRDTSRSDFFAHEFVHAKAGTGTGLAPNPGEARFQDRCTDFVETSGRTARPSSHVALTRLTVPERCDLIVSRYGKILPQSRRIALA
jgi:hypothetical protein